MGLYDRDYMKSEEWQRRHGYYPSRPSEESKPSEEKKETKGSKRGKAIVSILSLIIFIIFTLYALYQISSYNTPTNSSKKSSTKTSTYSTRVSSPASRDNLKFDTETIDPKENNWYNFFVAAEYLKQWKNSNINKAQKVNIIDLYLYTSTYIGKLVRLNMEDIKSEELSPSIYASKILNPGKATKVILSGVYIGDVIVVIQYHYAGPFELFADGDDIELCGYVIGKSKNITNLGYTCYSIILAGKYIEKLR